MQSSEVNLPHNCPLSGGRKLQPDERAASASGNTDSLPVAR